MWVDIPHLMVQAGVNPFPPQTGAEMVRPGRSWVLFSLTSVLKLLLKSKTNELFSFEDAPLFPFVV